MLELTENQVLILLDLVEDKLFMEEDIIRVEKLNPTDLYVEELKLMISAFKEVLPHELNNIVV